MSNKHEQDILKHYVDLTKNTWPMLCRDCKSRSEMDEAYHLWFDLIGAEIADKYPEYAYLFDVIKVGVVFDDLLKIQSTIPTVDSIDTLRELKNWLIELKRVAEKCKSYSEAQLMIPAVDSSLESIKDKLIQITEPMSMARRQALEIMSQRIDEEYHRDKKLGKAYDKYLETPEWQMRRQIKLEQANNRCQRQDKTCSGALDVHHLNYSRIPFEWDADLIVLCRSHHKRAHGRLL